MGRRIKVFVLCMTSLLALGAASAGAASAAPHWTVEGSSFGGTEALSKSVVLEKFGTQTTPKLTLTTGNVIKISCSAVEVEGSISEISLIPSLGVTLSGCVVLTSNNQPTTCQVSSNSNNKKGVLRAFQLFGELKPVGTKTYLVISGSWGTLSITECSIAANSQWGGAMAFEVQTGTSGTDLGVEASAATALATGAWMYVRGFNSYFEGNAKLSLSSGKSWGSASRQIQSGRRPGRVCPGPVDVFCVQHRRSAPLM